MKVILTIRFKNIFDFSLGATFDEMRKKKPNYNDRSDSDVEEEEEPELPSDFTRNIDLPQQVSNETSLK